MAVRHAALVLVIAAGCTSTPAEDAFDQAIDAVTAVDYVTSISVRQDGIVLRETYQGGGDATTPHDVRSVTKTVTALLIGTAIDTGCVRSLDQPIGELLGDPAPADPAKAAITVRDLLSMTSGLEWVESGAVGYNDWITAPNQVEYVLALPFVAEPGTTFNYNSGALHLVSAILTHACAPTPAFADQHLFGPLGIPSPIWEFDAQGIANGAAGLRLTNPQLAQIGTLILDRGMRLGTQIVPAAYVDLVTQRQTDTPYQGTREYGLGIWLGERTETGRFALAEGFGGQFIAIVPDRRAIIVVTTRWEGLGTYANTNFGTVFHILINQLLPALPA